MKDINLGNNISGYSEADTGSNSFWFFNIFQERIWQITQFRKYEIETNMFLRFISSKKNELLTHFTRMLKRSLGLK